jgi:ATP-dependent helicase HrpA
VAEAARESSVAGLQRLVALVLAKEFAWLQRDLRALGRLDALYGPIGSAEELQETALENLRRHILPAEPLAALTEASFRAAVDAARGRFSGVARELTDRLAPILQLHAEIARRCGLTLAPTRNARAGVLRDLAQLTSTEQRQPAHPLAAELKALMPPRFLERVPFERLRHFPRYLKALLLRIERAASNPVRDRERARQVAPYTAELEKLRREQGLAREASRLVEEFRWLIEEFKVSLHAQELGTAVPVSAKRLDQFLEAARERIGSRT